MHRLFGHPSMRKMTGYLLYRSLAESLSPLIQNGLIRHKLCELSRKQQASCYSLSLSGCRAVETSAPELSAEWKWSSNPQWNHTLYYREYYASIIFTYFWCDKNLLANSISAFADVSNMQMLNIKFKWAKVIWVGLISFFLQC